MPTQRRGPHRITQETISTALQARVPRAARLFARAETRSARDTYPDTQPRALLLNAAPRSDGTRRACIQAISVGNEASVAGREHGDVRVSRRVGRIFTRRGG
jgi:hypothetical protein